MDNRYKSTTHFHFAGPEAADRQVHVCIKWDIEFPLIMIGNWTHPPVVGDFIRREGYVFEWASIGVEMIREERAQADCQKSLVRGGIPSNVRYYELLKSSQSEREHPVSKCKIKWEESSEDLVARKWSVEAMTRVWTKSPNQKIAQKINWILDQNQSSVEPEVVTAG